MSFRVKRAVLALVVVVVLVAALVAFRRRRPLGPVLVVRSIVAGNVPDEREGDEARAMALAVASIAAGKRKDILELMDYTTARLEARLSPIGTDFGEGEGDPVEQFQRAMAAYMPSFTAARELERGAWRSADLAVRVEASCVDARLGPGEACILLWEPSDGPKDTRRARFLSWAASAAAVVDLGTRERVEACARALRERTSLAASVLALVLTEDDLALRPVPERPALQEAARRLGRAMAANDIRDTSHLEAFARAAPEGRVAPWLAVSPAMLVVVPRLSALARPDVLTAEVESAAGAGPIRWVHRP